MAMQAVVQSVQTKPGGDYVREETPEGSMTIPFVDASDFEPDGGEASIHDVVVAYTGVDLEDDVMHLADPLPFALDPTDYVTSLPAIESSMAVVAFGDDVLSAEIPHSLKAMLPEGERSPDTAEVVMLEQVGIGSHRIVDVVGSVPVIVAGDPTGSRVQITRDGLSLFVESPNPMADPYELVSITNGRVSFGVMREDGTILGGVSRDGVVSGSTASIAGDMTVKGVPLVGQLGGGLNEGWLDRLPRGIIAYNGRSKSLSASTETERRYLNVTATLYPGRRYRVVARIRVRPNASDSAVYVQVKHAPGADRPLMTDPYLGPTEIGSAASASSGNMRVTPEYEGFITVEMEQVHSFVSTFAGYYGAAPDAQSGHIYVEDVGPSVPPSGGIDDDPGESTNFYTTTWTATEAKRYDMSGAMIDDSGSIDQWYWRGDTPDYQAAAMLFGGFSVDSDYPDDIGKTIQQALLDATVRSVTVTIRNKLFYIDDQGVIGIGALGGTTLPSTLAVNSTQAATLTSGELVSINLPPSSFQGGTNTGITFGDKDGKVPGVSAPLESGSFHGIHDAEPPTLTITYTR